MLLRFFVTYTYQYSAVWNALLAVHLLSGIEKPVQSFLLSMSQFSFIITLVATQNVLSHTKRLSVKLQGPYVDIPRAHREIRTLQSSLKQDANGFHSHIRKQTMTIAQSFGVEECTPRLASRQQHQQNIPVQNPTEYYHLSLTISQLDQLINEL